MNEDRIVITGHTGGIGKAIFDKFTEVSCHKIIGMSRSNGYDIEKDFDNSTFIPKYVQNNFKSIKVHKTGNISISVIKALNEIRTLKPKINNNIDPKLFYKIDKPDVISKLKDFIITFNGKNENDKSFIFFKNEKFTGYGYFDLFNNINTEQKLNSRLVEVDESDKVKNYVYRLIFQKKYKKLLTLKEIYKFSELE